VHILYPMDIHRLPQNWVTALHERKYAASQPGRPMDVEITSCASWVIANFQVNLCSAELPNRGVRLHLLLLYWDCGFFRFGQNIVVRHLFSPRTDCKDGRVFSVAVTVSQKNLLGALHTM
jgi:hypothetical protein